MSMERVHAEHEVQDKSDDSDMLLAVNTHVGKRVRRMTYGVTIRSFEARNGSGAHSKGSLCLSLGSPIYNALGGEGVGSKDTGLLW